MSSLFISILKIIGYIFVFFVILYLAQFTSRYIAKKNEIFYKNKKIKVIEKLYLGKEKEIVILNYNNKEYLIGLCANNITKLDTFESKDEKYE